ncbi:hypothetical protein C471_14937 [Halorubrum saccharovorum DSM 1137]|uniref:Uncharacterized protein n=1 Tax=Halorubrum saccharovorum DSM 1137 TaxID=1227484 RepID=M0DKX6_9EURY|nr:hypothetical protein C471_14937 [Halorubrum saccharovorum DSM 1137]
MYRAHVDVEILDGRPDRRSSWELLRGGIPDVSRIVPWGVQSIDHEDIDFWHGRLDSDLVDEAVAALVEELH